MAKPNTTIKRDSHGLYVRTGGYVFRPVLTRWSYARFQPAYLAKLKARDEPRHGDPYAYVPDPLLFAEGELVTARHQGGTVFATVKASDGREAAWVSHGDYFGKTSEECWIDPVVKE